MGSWVTDAQAKDLDALLATPRVKGRPQIPTLALTMPQGSGPLRDGRNDSLFLDTLPAAPGLPHHAQNLHNQWNHERRVGNPRLAQ